MLLFLVFRLWFIAWHPGLWSAQQPQSVFLALFFAWPLDCSTTAYVSVLPLLLWTLGILLGEKAQSWLRGLMNGYMFLVIALLVLILGANVFMYSEWNTVLSHRALAYLKTPRALFDSMSTGFILACALLYLGFVYGWYKVWSHQLRPSFVRALPRRAALGLPLWLGLLALMMRGGLGVMAINESAVYYSSHLFDNHAATNAAWHLIHTQLEAKTPKHAFKYMDETEAKQKVDALRTGPSDFDASRILKTVQDTPLNLVVILMESMTAQVIEELDGEKGVCPNMSRLIREAVLFSNCYSSGFRTDQGVVAALSGYPAQPDQSIMFQVDKAARLNSLFKTLHTKGYSTLFCMGGEPTFANTGSWMLGQRVEKMLSEGNFDKADKTQRWGVDDKKLLQRFLSELNALKRPFMAGAITLSLHPPFDVPHQSRWMGGSDADKFLHSANFADEAIGQFFDAARNQDWYKHTLFVLVADHGAVLPHASGQEDPTARRIPLLLLGEPLQETWKGKKIMQYGNHHDIPATVLPLVGQSAAGFPWSRNLLAPADGFAYCVNENGMLWLQPGGQAFYGFEDKRWKMLQGALSGEDQMRALAYLQVFYQDFLNE